MIWTKVLAVEALSPDARQVVKVLILAEPTFLMGWGDILSIILLLNTS
ncbi:hypothetical protein [Nostoc sp.]